MFVATKHGETWRVCAPGSPGSPPMIAASFTGMEAESKAREYANDRNRLQVEEGRHGLRARR